MKIDKQSLELRRFDYNLTPDPEIKLLTIRDHLILSASNFTLLTGAPKVGKSSFITAILASYIARKPIFDIQLHHTGPNKRVALFDTEQANYDLHKAIFRCMELSQAIHFPDNLDIFALRKDDPATVLKILEYYINSTPECEIIILDGLLDLVFNFNEERECKMLIDFLKRITATYNIGILAVLHTGKTTGTTVGHIGSFADRYCQSNLEIFKDRADTTLNLKPKLLRSAANFTPISLMRDTYGKLFQVEYYEEEQKAKGNKR